MRQGVSGWVAGRLGVRGRAPGDTVPVSMMLPPKVSRSTIAAQSHCGRAASKRGQGPARYRCKSQVGYARVSTDHQSLEAQQDALTAAGCERIFTDTLSGARDDRPGLTELLAYVRSGDTVVVTALDRLGRSLSAVIRTVEILTVAGVLLRSLREGIDYSIPTGRLLAGIFAFLAEYERELMHERPAAARTAARLRGRHSGRPLRLTPPRPGRSGPCATGGESIADLVTSFGVSRATVYRALATTETPGEAPTAAPAGFSPE